MTSTSSSSTLPPKHYKYDLFISFRGADTRYNFTDHLYEALRKAVITTFRDEDEIQDGQELKPEIERAITESRASVIIFSENFANSSWCLDELWLILEQKRKHGHFVLPVFYGVDPSDVRNQRGSFKIEAKDGSKWTHDNVKRWKAALREVANLKGVVVSGYETTCIPNIVEKVYSQVDVKLNTTPTCLTGIETRAEVITSWLYIEDPESPVLSICGMEGSGKTTLAQHIYYSNKHNFDTSSLVDIEKQPDGLLGVQKQLLKDISGNNNMMISNVYEGAFQLEKVIQMNKVLIVVDGIDDKDTLLTLFGTVPFPTQSKIIITSIQNIDTWHGSISRGCHVYNVELLNDLESLELFSFHAFGSKVPFEGLEELAVPLAQYCEGNPQALKELAVQVAQYCEGNPLALKELALLLAQSVGAQDQWTRNDIQINDSPRQRTCSQVSPIDKKFEVELGVSFNSESETGKTGKATFSVEGVYTKALVNYVSQFEDLLIEIENYLNESDDESEDEFIFL